MNAYQMIQAGKKEMEQFVMKSIRAMGTYRPLTPSTKVFNAIDRLERQGKIKWHKKLGGYYEVKENRNERIRKPITQRS